MRGGFSLCMFLMTPMVSVDYCSPVDTCQEEEAAGPLQGKPGQGGHRAQAFQCLLIHQAFISTSLGLSEERNVCLSKYLYPIFLDPEFLVGTSPPTGVPTAAVCPGPALWMLLTQCPLLCLFTWVVLETFPKEGLWTHIVLL